MNISANVKTIDIICKGLLKNFNFHINDKRFVKNNHGDKQYEMAI